MLHRYRCRDTMYKRDIPQFEERAGLGTSWVTSSRPRSIHSVTHEYTMYCNTSKKCLSTGIVYWYTGELQEGTTASVQGLRRGL
jgi:hypothetical protein